MKILTPSITTSLRPQRRLQGWVPRLPGGQALLGGFGPLEALKAALVIAFVG